MHHVGYVHHYDCTVKKANHFNGAQHSEIRLLKHLKHRKLYMSTSHQCYFPLSSPLPSPASLSSLRPRLIALPETPVTVSEGERVVLECATDGATATISWSHTSLVSLPNNSYVSLSLSLHQSTQVVCVFTTDKVASLVCWLVDVSLKHRPLPLPLLHLLMKPEVYSYAAFVNEA